MWVLASGSADRSEGERLSGAKHSRADDTRDEESVGSCDTVPSVILIFGVRWISRAVSAGVAHRR